jgi:hypothetical protein
MGLEAAGGAAAGAAAAAGHCGEQASDLGAAGKRQGVGQNRTGRAPTSAAWDAMARHYSTAATWITHSKRGQRCWTACCCTCMCGEASWSTLASSWASERFRSSVLAAIFHMRDMLLSPWPLLGGQGTTMTQVPAAAAAAANIWFQEPGSTQSCWSTTNVSDYHCPQARGRGGRESMMLHRLDKQAAGLCMYCERHACP